MSQDIQILLILILPLIGGLSDFLLKDNDRSVSTFFIAAAFTCSLYSLIIFDNPYSIRWEWFAGFEIGILVDRSANLLLVLVTLISLLVHLFSTTYMEGDRGRPRYFKKLGFFTFAMLGLIISDNLLLLFIFWELVGFASYLLIGFWYDKKGVATSARTAFMVNRIADVALFAGILILNAQHDSIFISDFQETWFLLPSVLVAIGAFGKSAQLPFSGWLTKAMVGPTPVSALIHAATMVAAGVYLLYRVSPFLDGTVLVIVAVVGAVTTLYAALSATVQNDIKKVLAYSTISQLGYMVMGIGVGARGAAMFHLWTHAFFKAGLFLGAGVVIHYLQKLSTQTNNSIDPQDMRIMGGLRNRLPITFWSFLICGFALAGIPLFSGFLSKESIILSSRIWADQIGTWAYLVPDVALLSVIITAFYIARLIVLVFLGESRIGELVHSKESFSMKLPLIILSLGSFWILYAWNPFSHDSWMLQYFNSSPILDGSENTFFITVTSVSLALGGMALAYFLFRPGTDFSKGYMHAGSPRGIGGKALYNGFYLTQAYKSFGSFVLFSAQKIHWADRKVLDGIVHAFAVSGVVLAKVINIVDRLIVDGLVNFIARIAKELGNRLAGIHAREIQSQLIWLLLAIVLILSWILLF